MHDSRALKGGKRARARAAALVESSYQSIGMIFGEQASSHRTDTIRRLICLGKAFPTNINADSQDA